MSAITPAAAREAAHRQIRARAFAPDRNPLATLKSYPWTIPVGEAPSQMQVGRWNLALDGRSCLGRVAQAIALLECHHAGTPVTYAEVWSDMLAVDMRSQAQASLPEDPGLRGEWLRELLMYEEPHAVVRMGKEQFDPLSVSLGVDVCHPIVTDFPAWEGVTSAMIVALMNLTTDIRQKMSLLDEAESICPGTLLVAENRFSLLLASEREDEAIRLLKSVVRKRMSARGLYCLWLCTTDKKYLEELEVLYTRHMLGILQGEHHG